MENTMLLVASLMYHEKKTLQWGPPAGFGPIPSTWLALMLRQDFSQAHVVAHLGLHLETLGNPRSKCRFAGKNTSKWLMFHCHISLPEGRYPARPIVVTFHVSLLSIKKKKCFKSHRKPCFRKYLGNMNQQEKLDIHIYIYMYIIYIYINPKIPCAIVCQFWNPTCPTKSPSVGHNEQKHVFLPHAKLFLVAPQKKKSS
jgi:hypothetical protein